MSAMDSPMRVPASLDWLGRLVGNHPHFWIKAGNLETKLLAEDIRDIRIESPVFVSGLARSGSTLLLEILASHPDVTTHRYSDFPFLFTPYWWNTLLRLNPLRDTSQRERAHGDGMMVGADSPEAMEEMLWMGFFPNLHEGSQPIPAFGDLPAFDRFYREHLQKLLLVRKRRRYLSKGNYNLSRLRYLQSLFPDARFIIPVRDPVEHIVSLMRQHERFCEAGAKDARVARHMSLVGHFEFGLNRRPANTGNALRLRAITEAWNAGEEIRGWALYWDMIYGFILRERIGPLESASLVMPFESLCDHPQSSLEKLFAHAKLPADQELIRHWANAVRKPGYYASPLKPAEIQLIRDITGETASLYGYRS